MSKALCCDRCGKCFDPLTSMHANDLIVKFSNPVIRRLQDVADGTTSGYLIKEFREFDSVDLCPRCTEDFLDFMIPESGIEVEEAPKRRK
jgi:hypothetical protein